ncbi:hypothetical protein VLK31_07070 [Variovorax sp. H27-G14]|uniref:hypothetical protein n=1 Tax=Variovorax sp. H27-G14 TaxID=3111914 RepID=UPI0038FD3B51
MTTPQFRGENRKSPGRLTHGMQVLALMADGGLMTCKTVQRTLDVSPKYSRNIVCRLVTQQLAVQVTPKGYGISATYRITPSGRAQVIAAQLLARAAIDLDDEQDTDELAERAAARARIDTDLAWARAKVPNSVFALGAAHPARETVRAQVRGEGVSA